MTLDRQQARIRLAEARSKMALATKVRCNQGRTGFDIDAGVAEALLEVINFLEDALA